LASTNPFDDISDNNIEVVEPSIELVPPDHLSPAHYSSLEEALTFYDIVWDQGLEAIAQLAERDRFFLLTYVLRRLDAISPWLYARCREVETSPNGYVDLWAREHYKSTIITFAGIIQEIARDPEITISIFSFTNPNAKKFLVQIKEECEGNKILPELWPHIFWENPKKEAPRWSLDNGLVFKRQSNPKEATLEAHGLVDGMPTGGHYRLRVYDDVVTDKSVTTPDMIQKVTDAWRLSLNLGTSDGRAWYIGTIYHFNDTYRIMIDQGSAQPRIYPATEDGTPTGKPVFITAKSLSEKRRDMGPYIFAAQMLLNPVADEAQGFKAEWLEYYDSNNYEGMNIYILVDPANEKKKTSDYTAMMVVGLAADRNYYVIDMIRDRLNLKERGDALFTLHQTYKPLSVGYEKYGIQADIEYLRERMNRQNYRFNIVELGGQVAKPDRIRKLVPMFEQHRMLLPMDLFKVNYEGKKVDLVRQFIEHEYTGFPVAQHDDMLDCLSRIRDPAFPTSWPLQSELGSKKRDRYARNHKPVSNYSWMAR